MNQVIERQAPFIRRFALLSRRQRQLQLWKIFACAALVLLAGFAIATSLDFIFELQRGVRSGLLMAVTVASLSYAGIVLSATVRRWSQAATATEIEQAFPELGQCVRTTMEFSALSAEQVQSAGVAPTLVHALAQQTHERALPLTIEDVIPLGSLRLAVGSLAAGLLLIAGFVNVDWQWRTAAERVLLAERPYRSLEVSPGDHTVLEGGALDVHVVLRGRTNQPVRLQIRESDGDDQAWIDRELQEVDASAAPPSKPAAAAGYYSLAGSPSPPQQTFSSHFNRLVQPLDYRVSVGEVLSPVYRVGIRSPLRIRETEVTLTPPAYTGLPPITSPELNLVALQGTTARIVLRFDQPVKSAGLMLSPIRPQIDAAQPEPVELPITLVPLAAPQTASEGRGSNSPANTQGTVEFSLAEDAYYTIRAEPEDGIALRESKYRIRVREDQPPLVGFQEPRDAVEVHSLAEILLQIRVTDDYGLSQAGIVFQINNEQEVPLVSQDFATVAQADAELRAAGAVTPTTRAMLEKVLPLELFELTQKDSVLYYAFAVDTRPDQPQRTETDLQYIDIRPFKRTYQVVDPDPMPGGGMGGGFRSLEELIRRQRFALNRTQKIERHAAIGRPPSPDALTELMTFETDLADSTRESAQGLEARGFDDTELFYQAEASMRQAVDSLSVGKWENASLQMRDALKALIEQRDRVQLFIFKNPDPARLAQLRDFDRLQSQKLRRPKSDREEARELIRRLEELATEEAGVAKNLEPSGEQVESPPGAEAN